MPNPIALVDVDDVMVQFVKALLKKYNALFPFNGKPLLFEDITDWDLTKFVPESFDIHGLYKCQDFYDDAEPYGGALEGVRALRNYGFRVVYVTNAVNEHAGAKLRWLKKNGFIDSNKDYVETADKGLILGDIIIDDAIHNLVVGERKLRMKMVRPWNKEENSSAFVNVRDWTNVINVLKMSWMDIVSGGK